MSIIIVNNSGFETQKVKDGKYTTNYDGKYPAITDWAVSGVNVGVYDPKAEDAIGGIQGENVGYLEDNWTTISQVLSGYKYNADEQITFSIDIGDPNYATASNYRLEILAGNTVVGTLNGTTDGTDALSTATVISSSPKVALNDLAVTIRITKTSGAGQEIHIDNAQASYALLSNGIVEGTNAGQSMGIGFVDTDGDIIDGTDDSIQGNGGNDTIDAGAGDDTVDGGTGNDTINAGVGDDTVDGGTGNDIINAGVGDDTVDGGTGNDIIHGGNGADTIDGGTGNDFINAGAGNDSVDGGTGNDTINAGADNDTIVASTDTDTIDGGDGADTYTVLDSSTIVDVTETVTVVVDNDGDGTVFKAIDCTTDTVTSIETFIADEALAENDIITINDTDIDDATFDPTGTLFARSEISNLDNNSVGTFTLQSGTVINFGPNTTNTGLPGVADGILLSTILNNNAPGVSGTGTIQITSGDESGTVGRISFENFETINFGLLCFASGTMIKTIDGERAIETLTVGDRVLTMDGNYQEIRWIDSLGLDSIDLQMNPRLKPIIIRADALGAGFPEQDLIVSPQHRIFVRSMIAERMFDTREVLIPANKLLTLDGIDILEHNPDGVEYWHMLFDDHQIVWSNGTPSESLFIGPEALKAVSPEGRLEIQTLFPEICDPDFQPRPARFIPEKGKLMKKLAQRHQANKKDIVNRH
ncbi:MAG: Hint domain-containing protein [Planktotalea sp.]|uniref:Hint domain-containing protein n=1 Tax=Planktotalea sp. TaxID=2029877 RepID=UPI002604E728|nr:Hint domain-containing protein [Planktotalea sp.]MDG1083581.1 Hint domain-containing protein [Planktotalea sp.]